MKKLIWALVIFFAYIWIVSNGHEDWIFNQIQKSSDWIANWFSDADLDFQTDNKIINKVKKRSRRWD